MAGDEPMSAPELIGTPPITPKNSLPFSEDKLDKASVTDEPGFEGGFVTTLVMVTSQVDPAGIEPEITCR